MLKAIIFGISGQSGHYLRHVCARNHLEVTGVARSRGDWIAGDVSDREFVDRIIMEMKPDFVFHLAADSTTHHSSLFANHAAIATGTLNILEAVKEHSPGTKVFITGSGVQFKNTGHPISESDEFEASSVYAVARIHSVFAARYYRSLGIKTYVGYLFHHESPLRKFHHISKMTTDFIRQVAAGGNKKLELGDISVKKEWAYAEDIAEGIFTLVSQENIFEAAIGTGQIYSIEQWLEECFKIIDKNWKDYIVVPERNFVPEYKVLYSNPATMFSLGWKPKTSFRELAEIMMQ